MKYKKIMLILITAIFLVSIAGVCAADANDTLVANEDTSQIELSDSNKAIEDNLQTSEENTKLAENDETLSSEINSEILTDGQYTYSNLREQIGSGGNKSLTKGTYTYNQNDGGAIIIRDSGVIDGNGAVIDMARSTIRAFYVTASDVTIKNITIKNANYDGSLGVIYFSSPGTVENCNFADNSARGHGGVIYGGSAVNCTFTANSAGLRGGAIYEGSAVNCTFISNSAKYGGAMYGGSAVNCTFKGNSASEDGGAIFGGNADNCNFTDNHAGKEGGAMYEGTAGLCFLNTSSDTLYNTNALPTFSVSNSILILDLGEKLLFNLTYDNKNYDGYNTTITLKQEGNPIGVYYVLSGCNEGWSVDLNQGFYTATLSLEQYTAKPVTVSIFVGINEDKYSGLSSEIGSGGDIKLQQEYYTYDYGGTIKITKPNTVIDGNGAVIDMTGSNIRAFYVSASDVTIKNLTIKNANYEGSGGAIYFSSLGTVENCNFADNSVTEHGGAIYGGSAVNCTFKGNSAGGWGGAFCDGSSAVNCTFISNSAKYGGAMSGPGFSAVNCTFISNSASENGGAIVDGNADNCNFTDNHAKEGGAMYEGAAVFCILKTSSDTLYNTDIPTFSVSKSLLRFDSGDKLLFNLTYDNKNYDGYNTTINITKDGNPFDVYYTLSGSDEGWSVDLNTGIYAATLSLEQYAVKPQTVVIVVGEVEGTYLVLFGEIGSGGGYINLQYDYYTYDYGSPIVITKSDTVIDGNGAVIDMAGSNIRAFDVTGNGVTIKNLTIKNANFWENGGAIKFAGDYGAVINCNFINNTAQNGGAIYFDNTGNVKNCNFADNSAISVGGAIYSYYWSAADTCIFKTGSDTTYHIDFLTPTLNVDNFTTAYGSGEKLTFDLKTNSSIPVTNGNISISVYFKDNGDWVGNYSCLSGEGWIPDLLVGSYYAIFDTEYAEFQPVNRTITITMPDGRYYVNVTSLTAINKIVNITAKTNVPNDIIWDGKLLFILPIGTEINANYAGNGIWWAMHTFDIYGIWDVSASYARLDNVTINNATITIYKGNSTMTLDDVVLNYCDSIKVNVKTEGSLGITAMIDGEDVGVVKYSILISGLNAGNHTLTVTTIPDYYYVASTKTVNITVNRLKTELKASTISTTYNINKDLVITLSDAKGNPLSGVIINVNLGSGKFTTDRNGQVKINVANLVPNTYTVKITFNGDANYDMSSKDVNVAVTKATPKLTAAKKTFKKSVKTKKYSITLKDNRNKAISKATVTIKIKGKTYKASTNAKGVATFKIKKLAKKGTFKSTVKYAGNAYYRAVTKTVKIKIK